MSQPDEVSGSKMDKQLLWNESSSCFKQKISNTDELQEQNSKIKTKFQKRMESGDLGLLHHAGLSLGTYHLNDIDHFATIDSSEADIESDGESGDSSHFSSRSSDFGPPSPSLCESNEICGQFPYDSQLLERSFYLASRSSSICVSPSDGSNSDADHYQSDDSPLFQADWEMGIVISKAIASKTSKVGTSSLASSTSSSAKETKGKVGKEKKGEELVARGRDKSTEYVDKNLRGTERKKRRISRGD